MVYEAQLLFTSVLGVSAYLGYRVLEAGLLGPLSAKYFSWAGRSEERRKLDLALNAEKASVIFKGPPTETKAKQAFEEHILKVPVDEATGEAIIEGPLYKEWVNMTNKLLIERTCETIVNYRAYDQYFKETFCKMTQGLASNRAYRDADQARQTCDLELQDIMEWAKRLRPGWETRIIKDCVQLVDQQMKRKMQEQFEKDQELNKENIRKQKDRAKARFLAAEVRYKGASGSSASPAPQEEEIDEDAARKAEEELLRDETQTPEKTTSGKKKKKN